MSNLFESFFNRGGAESNSGEAAPNSSSAVTGTSRQKYGGPSEVNASRGQTVLPASNPKPAPSPTMSESKTPVATSIPSAAKALVLPEEKIVDIDSLKQFTIPKKKKAKRDLYEKILVSSSEYTRELLPLVTKTFKDAGSSKVFNYTRPVLIHNTDLLDAYLDRRKEWRQDGYSDKDIIDSYGFLCVESNAEMKQICEEGISTGNESANNILGCSSMGVYLSRHADIIRPTGMSNGYQGKLIVFKFMKGKVKSMMENRGGVALEPTPNFDCHVSKNFNFDLSSTSQSQAFESTQVYIYEYGDLGPEQRPRQIYPYAVLNFNYTGSRTAGPARQPKSRTSSSQRAVAAGVPRLQPLGSAGDSKSSPLPTDAFPVPSPPIRSPLTPGSKKSKDKPPVTSVGQSVDGNGCVVWEGKLLSKGTAMCGVELVTYGQAVRPASIGPSLNVVSRIPLGIVRTKYLVDIGSLRKDTELFARGKWYRYSLLRPARDSIPKFNQVMTYLLKKESAALVKLEGGTQVIVLTNCDITQKLGLSEARSYPLVLHLLFISTTARTEKLQRIGSKNIVNERDQQSTDSTFKEPPQVNRLVQKQSSTEVNYENGFNLLVSANSLLYRPALNKEFHEQAVLQERINIERGCGEMNVGSTTRQPGAPTSAGYVPGAHSAVPSADYHKQQYVQDGTLYQGLGQVHGKPSLLGTPPGQPGGMQPQVSPQRMGVMGYGQNSGQNPGFPADLTGHNFSPGMMPPVNSSMPGQYNPYSQQYAMSQAPQQYLMAQQQNSMPGYSSTVSNPNLPKSLSAGLPLNLGAPPPPPPPPPPPTSMPGSMSGSSLQNSWTANQMPRPAEGPSSISLAMAELEKQIELEKAAMSSLGKKHLPLPQSSADSDSDSEEQAKPVTRWKGGQLEMTDALADMIVRSAPLAAKAVREHTRKDPRLHRNTSVEAEVKVAKENAGPVPKRDSHQQSLATLKPKKNLTNVEVGKPDEVIDSAQDMKALLDEALEVPKTPPITPEKDEMRRQQQRARLRKQGARREQVKSWLANQPSPKTLEPASGVTASKPVPSPTSKTALHSGMESSVTSPSLTPALATTFATKDSTATITPVCRRTTISTSVTTTPPQVRTTVSAPITKTTPTLGQMTASPPVITTTRPPARMTISTPVMTTTPPTARMTASASVITTTPPLPQKHDSAAVITTTSPLARTIVSASVVDTGIGLDQTTAITAAQVPARKIVLNLVTPTPRITPATPTINVPSPATITTAAQVPARATITTSTINVLMPRSAASAQPSPVAPVFNQAPVTATATSHDSSLIPVLVAGNVQRSAPVMSNLGTDANNSSMLSGRSRPTEAGPTLHQIGRVVSPGSERFEPVQGVEGGGGHGSEKSPIFGRDSQTSGHLEEARLGRSDCDKKPGPPTAAEIPKKGRPLTPTGGLSRIEVICEKSPKKPLPETKFGAPKGNLIYIQTTQDFPSTSGSEEDNGSLTVGKLADLAEPLDLEIFGPIDTDPEDEPETVPPSSPVLDARAPSKSDGSPTPTRILPGGLKPLSIKPIPVMGKTFTGTTRPIVSRPSRPMAGGATRLPDRSSSRNLFKYGRKGSSGALKSPMPKGVDLASKPDDGATNKTGSIPERAATFDITEELDFDMGEVDEPGAGKQASPVSGLQGANIVSKQLPYNVQQTSQSECVDNVKQVDSIEGNVSFDAGKMQTDMTKTHETLLPLVDRDSQVHKMDVVVATSATSAPAGYSKPQQMLVVDSDESPAPKKLSPLWIQRLSRITQKMVTEKETLHLPSSTLTKDNETRSQVLVPLRNVDDPAFLPHAKVEVGTDVEDVRVHIRQEPLSAAESRSAIPTLPEEDRLEASCLIAMHRNSAAESVDDEEADKDESRIFIWFYGLHLLPSDLCRARNKENIPPSSELSQHQTSKVIPDRVCTVNPGAVPCKKEPEVAVWHSSGDRVHLASCVSYSPSVSVTDIDVVNSGECALRDESPKSKCDLTQTSASDNVTAMLGASVSCEHEHAQPVKSPEPLAHPTVEFKSPPLVPRIKVTELKNYGDIKKQTVPQQLTWDNLYGKVKQPVKTPELEDPNEKTEILFIPLKGREEIPGKTSTERLSMVIPPASESAKEAQADIPQKSSERKERIPIPEKVGKKGRDKSSYQRDDSLIVTHLSEIAKETRSDILQASKDKKQASSDGSEELLIVSPTSMKAPETLLALSGQSNDSNQTEKLLDQSVKVLNIKASLDRDEDMLSQISLPPLKESNKQMETALNHEELALKDLSSSKTSEFSLLSSKEKKELENWSDHKESLRTTIQSEKLTKTVLESHQSSNENQPTKVDHKKTLQATPSSESARHKTLTEINEAASKEKKIEKSSGSNESSKKDRIGSKEKLSKEKTTEKLSDVKESSKLKFSSDKVKDNTLAELKEKSSKERKSEKSLDYKDSSRSNSSSGKVKDKALTDLKERSSKDKKREKSSDPKDSSKTEKTLTESKEKSSKENKQEKPLVQPSKSTSSSEKIKDNHQTESKDKASKEKKTEKSSDRKESSKKKTLIESKDKSSKENKQEKPLVQPSKSTSSSEKVKDKNQTESKERASKEKKPEKSSNTRESSKRNKILTETKEKSSKEKKIEKSSECKESPKANFPLQKAKDKTLVELKENALKMKALKEKRPEKSSDSFKKSSSTSSIEKAKQRLSEVPTSVAQEKKKHAALKSQSCKSSKDDKNSTKRSSERKDKPSDKTKRKKFWYERTKVQKYFQPVVQLDRSVVERYLQKQKAAQRLKKEKANKEKVKANKDRNLRNSSLPSDKLSSQKHHKRSRKVTVVDGSNQNDRDTCSRKNIRQKSSRKRIISVSSDSEGSDEDDEESKDRDKVDQSEHRSRKRHRSASSTSSHSTTASSPKSKRKVVLCRSPVAKHSPRMMSGAVKENFLEYKSQLSDILALKKAGTKSSKGHAPSSSFKIRKKLPGIKRIESDTNNLGKALERKPCKVRLVNERAPHLEHLDQPKVKNQVLPLSVLAEMVLDRQAELERHMWQADKIQDTQVSSSQLTSSKAQVETQSQLKMTIVKAQDEGYSVHPAQPQLSAVDAKVQQADVGSSGMNETDNTSGVQAAAAGRTIKAASQFKPLCFERFDKESSVQKPVTDLEVKAKARDTHGSSSRSYSGSQTRHDPRRRHEGSFRSERGSERYHPYRRRRLPPPTPELDELKKYDSNLSHRELLACLTSSSYKARRQVTHLRASDPIPPPRFLNFRFKRSIWGDNDPDEDMRANSLREDPNEVDQSYSQTHVEDFERRRILCQELDSLLEDSGEQRVPDSVDTGGSGTAPSGIEEKAVLLPDDIQANNDQHLTIATKGLNADDDTLIVDSSNGTLAKKKKKKAKWPGLKYEVAVPQIRPVYHPNPTQPEQLQLLDSVVIEENDPRQAADLPKTSIYTRPSAEAAAGSTIQIPLVADSADANNELEEKGPFKINAPAVPTLTVSLENDLHETLEETNGEKNDTREKTVSENKVPEDHEQQKQSEQQQQEPQERENKKGSDQAEMGAITSDNVSFEENKVHNWIKSSQKYFPDSSHEGDSEPPEAEDASDLYTGTLTENRTRASPENRNRASPSHAKRSKNKKSQFKWSTDTKEGQHGKADQGNEESMKSLTSDTVKNALQGFVNDENNLLDTVKPRTVQIADGQSSKQGRSAHMGRLSASTQALANNSDAVEAVFSALHKTRDEVTKTLTDEVKRSGPPPIKHQHKPELRVDSTFEQAEGKDVSSSGGKREGGPKSRQAEPVLENQRVLPEDTSKEHSHREGYESGELEDTIEEDVAEEMVTINSRSRRRSREDRHAAKSRSASAGVDEEPEQPLQKRSHDSTEKIKHKRRSEGSSGRKSRRHRRQTTEERWSATHEKLNGISDYTYALAKGLEKDAYKKGIDKLVKQNRKGMIRSLNTLCKGEPFDFAEALLDEDFNHFDGLSLGTQLECTFTQESNMVKRAHYDVLKDWLTKKPLDSYLVGKYDISDLNIDEIKPSLKIDQTVKECLSDFNEGVYELMKGENELVQHSNVFPKPKNDTEETVDKVFRQVHQYMDFVVSQAEHSNKRNELHVNCYSSPVEEDMDRVSPEPEINHDRQGSAYSSDDNNELSDEGRGHKKSKHKHKKKKRKHKKRSKSPDKRQKQRFVDYPTTDEESDVSEPPSSKRKLDDTPEKDCYKPSNTPAKKKTTTGAPPKGVRQQGMAHIMDEFYGDVESLLNNSDVSLDGMTPADQHLPPLQGLRSETVKDPHVDSMIKEEMTKTKQHLSNIIPDLKLKKAEVPAFSLGNKTPSILSYSKTNNIVDTVNRKDDASPLPASSFRKENYTTNQDVAPTENSLGRVRTRSNLETRIVDKNSNVPPSPERERLPPREEEPRRPEQVISPQSEGPRNAYIESSVPPWRRHSAEKSERIVNSREKDRSSYARAPERHISRSISPSHRKSIKRKYNSPPLHYSDHPYRSKKQSKPLVEPEPEPEPEPPAPKVDTTYVDSFSSKLADPYSESPVPNFEPFFDVTKPPQGHFTNPFNHWWSIMQYFLNESRTGCDMKYLEKCVPGWSKCSSTGVLPENSFLLALSFATGKMPRVDSVDKKIATDDALEFADVSGDMNEYGSTLGANENGTITSRTRTLSTNSSGSATEGTLSADAPTGDDKSKAAANKLPKRVNTLALAFRQAVEAKKAAQTGSATTVKIPLLRKMKTRPIRTRLKSTPTKADNNKAQPKTPDPSTTKDVRPIPYGEDPSDVTTATATGSPKKVSLHTYFEPELNARIHSVMEEAMHDFVSNLKSSVKNSLGNLSWNKTILPPSFYSPTNQVGHLMALSGHSQRLFEELRDMNKSKWIFSKTNAAVQTDCSKIPARKDSECENSIPNPVPVIGLQPEEKPEHQFAPPVSALEDRVADPVSVMYVQMGSGNVRPVVEKPTVQISSTSTPPSEPTEEDMDVSNSPEAATASNEFFGNNVTPVSTVSYTMQQIPLTSTQSTTQTTSLSTTPSMVPLVQTSVITPAMPTVLLSQTQSQIAKFPVSSEISSMASQLPDPKPQMVAPVRQAASAAMVQVASFSNTSDWGSSSAEHLPAPGTDSIQNTGFSNVMTAQSTIATTTSEPSIITEATKETSASFSQVAPVTIPTEPVRTLAPVKFSLFKNSPSLSQKPATFIPVTTTTAPLPFVELPPITAEVLSPFIPVSTASVANEPTTLVAEPTVPATSDPPDTKTTEINATAPDPAISLATVSTTSTVTTSSDVTEPVAVTEVKQQETEESDKVQTPGLGLVTFDPIEIPGLGAPEEAVPPPMPETPAISETPSPTVHTTLISAGYISTSSPFVISAPPVLSTPITTSNLTEIPTDKVSPAATSFSLDAIPLPPAGKTNESSSKPSKWQEWKKQKEEERRKQAEVVQDVGELVQGPSPDWRKQVEVAPPVATLTEWPPKLPTDNIPPPPLPPILKADWNTPQTADPVPQQQQQQPPPHHYQQQGWYGPQYHPPWQGGWGPRGPPPPGWGGWHGGQQGQWRPWGPRHHGPRGPWDRPPHPGYWDHQQQQGPHWGAGDPQQNNPQGEWGDGSYHHQGNWYQQPPAWGPPQPHADPSQQPPYPEAAPEPPSQGPPPLPPDDPSPPPPEEASPEPPPPPMAAPGEDVTKPVTLGTERSENPVPAGNIRMFVFNQDQSICKSVQRFMSFLGAKSFDPYNVMSLQAIPSVETLVMVQVEDVPKVHEVPNLLALKTQEWVKFVAYESVTDVQQKSYSVILKAGGIAVPDDSILLSLQAESLRTVCEFMLKQRRTEGGEPWYLMVHNHVVNRLQNAREDDRLHQLYMILTRYEEEGVVRVMRSPTFDNTPMPPHEYLSLMLRLQAQYAYSTRHTVLLTDLPQSDERTLPFLRQGISVMNVSSFMRVIVGVPALSSIPLAVPYYGLKADNLFLDSYLSSCEDLLPPTLAGKLMEATQSQSPDDDY